MDKRMLSSFNEFIVESDTMTFVNAAKFILSQNGNKPMSAREIFDKIAEKNLVSTTNWKNAINTLSTKLIYWTDIFEKIEGTPIKFKLVTDDRIKEPEETQIEPGIENPFKQAICVLGESGAGKSHTIENILDNEGHEFEFIIPTAATTGLLSQFSPTKSGYAPSRLGKMVIDAAKNPSKFYTAVFDEMHKSNVIEMINDELLQCISIHRNNGVRFISLDQDTAELYNIEELEKKRGNIILPDNFGFIFISSKPRVIANNPDFFNRVDIVILKHYEEESVESSDELIDLVLDNEEKNKLVSTRND